MTSFTKQFLSFYENLLHRDSNMRLWKAISSKDALLKIKIKQGFMKVYENNDKLKVFWYWSSFHRVVLSKTRSRERLKSRYSRGLGRSVSYPVCVLDTIHKASLVLFDFLGFRNSWLAKHVWKQLSSSSQLMKVTGVITFPHTYINGWI